MSNTSGEKLQVGAETPLSLSGHLNDVNGAMAVLTGQATGNNGPNELFVGMAIAMAPVSPATSMFLGAVAAAVDEVSKKSQFLGEFKTTKQKKADPLPISSKPLPSQKPQSRFVGNITKPRAPIKAPKQKEKEKQLAELKKERDNTMHAMQGINSFDNPNAVEQGIKLNKQNAKDVAQRNPNVRPKIKGPSPA